jgi:hypothetical protein
MNRIYRTTLRSIGALLAASVFASAAVAADIAVEPATEGRYVSEVRVTVSAALAQVVVHGCDGIRTVHAPEEFPESSVFPVSVNGSHMAGITVMAGDSVRAVAFDCPDGADTETVSTVNARRSEGDLIEGALF